MLYVLTILDSNFPSKLNAGIHILNGRNTYGRYSEGLIVRLFNDTVSTAEFI
jgi:hypothetical protein